MSPRSAVDPFIRSHSAASGADWSRRSAGCRAARGRPEAGRTSCLDHDAAVAVPRAGPIAGVGVDVRWSEQAGRALGLRHEQGGLGVGAATRRSAGHRQLDVVEPWLGIQEVEDLRRRKAPVEPHEKPRTRGKACRHDRRQFSRCTTRPHSRGWPSTLPGRSTAALQILFALHWSKVRNASNVQVAPAIVVPVEEGELLRRRAFASSSRHPGRS